MARFFKAGMWWDGRFVGSMSDERYAAEYVSADGKLRVRFSLSGPLAAQKELVGKLDNDTVASFYEGQLERHIEAAGRKVGVYTHMFSIGESQVAELGRGVVNL